MLIVVIDALILVGLVLMFRDNNKTVNELLRYQLVTSSHIEELCKEVADLVQRVDALEAQAKQQGWPYDPTKK
jgi:cell division protein FtsB